MIEEKRRPQPLSATFYVKPRRATRKALAKIQLKLGSEAKVRKTVSAILKLVDLPTSYVDSIADDEVDCPMFIQSSITRERVQFC